MLARVVVSSPKVPAILGTSPAESIRPSPRSRWSRNTSSPATRIVLCKNAVRHRPMTCLHHCMKPSVYRIFWSAIEKEFLKNEADFHEIVKSHPENVFAQEDCQPGFFSYNLVDGNLDVVSLEEVFDRLIQPCKKEGEKVYNEYETAWKDYIRGRIAFRLIDENYLEVLPLEELLGN